MDFAAARRNMVESQLRTNRVTEPLLLAAMSEIPRERFVPEGRTALAYVDEDLPIGSGRYLMEPMVLGRLLQEARPDKDDAALCIGCGTGYSAAVLARLCGAVVALESDAGFAEKASAIFANLGIDNAVVVGGPLDEGWPKEAPYDVIIFDGAVASVPSTVLDQLGEGGRLVAVRRRGNGVGRGTLWLKRGGVVSHRDLFDASVPILPGFENRTGFVF